MKQFTIKQGNNIDTLKTYPDNHFDSIVTDPPYGIEFLGKDWDSNTGAVETWQECFRVLKPGGYLLAFSAARTYHHLATNIEGVGFEIRDQLMWLYASGFPKAQDIGKAIERREGKRKTQEKIDIRPEYSHGVKGYCVKCNLSENGQNQQKCVDVECPYKDNLKEADNEWAGWKTALKPAHEPIVMARKPFKGSSVDNVLKWGVGALNIDATRVDWDEKAMKEIKARNALGGEIVGGGIEKYATVGEDASAKHKTKRILLEEKGRFPSNVLGEVEGYQKYFYCPKVSRKERHCGFEAPPDPLANYSQGDVKNHPLWDPSIGTNLQRLKHKILEQNKDLGKKSLDHIPAPFGDVKGAYVDGERMAKVADDNQYASAGNNHPTVKPVELMKYLVKLVTPTGGKVLDPFCGSGSTGMACVELDYDFTGCELDENYVNIAETRINAWYEHTQPDTTFDEIFEEK